MKTISGKFLRNGSAAALLLAACALTGCVSMPAGTADRAETSFAGAEAQTDLFFRPGTAQLLPGEASRVNELLRSLQLNTRDDVVLVFGSTGSDTLDAQRVAAARQSIAPGPARLRIARPLGFARVPDSQADIVLVQVRRYDRALVTCPETAPGVGLASQALRLPAQSCTNAINIAAMAAEKRDLTAPRRLQGSQAIPSALAVGVYRAGEVTVPSVGSTKY